MHLKAREASHEWHCHRKWNFEVSACDLAGEKNGNEILSLLPTRDYDLLQKPNYDISQSLSRITPVSAHVPRARIKTQSQTQRKGTEGENLISWVCRRGKQKNGGLEKVWEVLRLDFWHKTNYSELRKETWECKITEGKWWMWEENKYSRNSVIRTSKLKGHFYTLSTLLRRVPYI